MPKPIEIDRKTARLIVTLIGNYQGYLESELDCQPRPEGLARG